MAGGCLTRVAQMRQLVAMRVGQLVHGIHPRGVAIATYVSTSLHSVECFCATTDCLVKLPDRHADRSTFGPRA